MFSLCTLYKGFEHGCKQELRVSMYNCCQTTCLKHCSSMTIILLNSSNFFVFSKNELENCLECCRNVLALLLYKRFLDGENYIHILLCTFSCLPPSLPLSVIPSLPPPPPSLSPFFSQTIHSSLSKS